MNTRIHALQVEIKAIENILASLHGPMLELAVEELKNTRFELDMLNRTLARTSMLLPVVEEAGTYA